jgi:hypothetical protein
VDSQQSSLKRVERLDIAYGFGYSCIVFFFVQVLYSRTGSYVCVSSSAVLVLVRAWCVLSIWSDLGMCLNAAYGLDTNKLRVVVLG